MAKKEIIIGVTGSIAAYKACDIISGLRRQGYNTTVVMTKEAGEFVTPLLLGHISANTVYPALANREIAVTKGWVYSDMWKTPEVWDLQHISLAQKADLILIAPATANIIAKLANGICDDLLSCVVMATKAPVLLAPAMNSNMWNHKATQENVRKLKAFGYKFIGPVKGKLACGVDGIGHIADTDVIVKEALKLAR